MPRHTKTVELTMTAKAQRKAWAEGPACEKCRRLTTGARGAVSCSKKHALGNAAGCSDFRDAAKASPAMPSGNGR